MKFLDQHLQWTPFYHDPHGRPTLPARTFPQWPTSSEWIIETLIFIKRHEETQISLYWGQWAIKFIGLLKKTVNDIISSLSAGFVIPQGWRIYVYTREINYDPCLYPDPFTFNPWRWMVIDPNFFYQIVSRSILPKYVIIGRLCKLNPAMNC